MTVDDLHPLAFGGLVGWNSMCGALHLGLPWYLGPCLGPLIMLIVLLCFGLQSIGWAAWFGHCRMCTVVLLSCLHLGHAVVSHWPHQCIICPVAQKLVVNLVIHSHCFIAKPFTTVCMIIQLMMDVHPVESCFICPVFLGSLSTGVV